MTGTGQRSLGAALAALLGVLFVGPDPATVRATATHPGAPVVAAGPSVALRKEGPLVNGFAIIRCPCFGAAGPGDRAAGPPAVDPATGRFRRPGWIWAAGGALFAALTAGGLRLLWRRRRDGAEAPGDWTD